MPVNTGRSLSPFLLNFFAEKAAQDARFYNSHLAIEITLKNASQLHYATGKVILSTLSVDGVSVAVDPEVEFEPKITNPPDIQFTQGSNADGSTPFDISNLDYLLSGIIPEPTRLFDNAKATVYICFPKPDGKYEGVIYTKGVLNQTDADDRVARLTFVSDLSNKTITTGGKSITQRCVNELGVSNSRSFCPSGSDIPAESVCSKEFDDEVAGCAFWGRQAFFNGVSFFNPEGLVPNYSGVIGGSGWGFIPPTRCVAADTWFLMADGSPKKGKDLKKGDMVKNHLGEVTVIDSVELFHAEMRYRVRSQNSGTTLICTPTHPFLISPTDKKGTSILSLLPDHNPSSKYSQIVADQVRIGITPPDKQENGARVVEYVNGIVRMSNIGVSVVSAGECVNIHTTDGHLLLHGEEKGKYFAGHNSKPFFDDLEIGNAFAYERGLVN